MANPFVPAVTSISPLFSMLIELLPLDVLTVMPEALEPPLTMSWPLLFTAMGLLAYADRASMP